MKVFEIYDVKFENCKGYNLRTTASNYDEAIKIFNKYKKNKQYESHRKISSAIVLRGWNYDDINTTEIKRENLNK